MGLLFKLNIYIIKGFSYSLDFEFDSSEVRYLIICVYFRV